MQGELRGVLLWGPSRPFAVQSVTGERGDAVEATHLSISAPTMSNRDGRADSPIDSLDDVSSPR